MTPALSGHSRFYKRPIDLAAMARRVIARDRGDGPGKLYPNILDGDRQACVATQERLQGLIRDRATHHHIVSEQEPGDGSVEALAESLDLLAVTVAKMPETAPCIIKLAETEMATGPLEATPGVTAALDAHASATTSMEGVIEAIVMATKTAEVTMETPGALTPSTPTSMPSGLEGTEA
jgi:hypothetical protein